jgi:transient receptor potential cation channel subfamily M protein 2
LSSFDHTGNDRKSKTLPECIVDLMRFSWKLPSPQLIISVTGGAQLFKLPTPRARHAFQRGLIAAAVTTGESFIHIYS